MDMGRPGKVLEFAKWKITMWNIGQLVNHHVYHLWMAMWKIAMLNSQRVIAGEQRMYMDVYGCILYFRGFWTTMDFQYLSIQFKKNGDVASNDWKDDGLRLKLAAGPFGSKKCPTEVQPSMSGLTKDGLTVTFTASASAGEVVPKLCQWGYGGFTRRSPPWSYFWRFFLAGRFGPFKSGSKPPNPLVEQHHFSADMAFFYWSKSANPHFSRKSDGWARYHLIPTAGGGTRKPYDCRIHMVVGSIWYHMNWWILIW